ALVSYGEVPVTGAESRPELQAPRGGLALEGVVHLVTVVLNERRGGGLGREGLARPAQRCEPRDAPVNARTERGGKEVRARAALQIPPERRALYADIAYQHSAPGGEAQLHEPVGAFRLRGIAHLLLRLLYHLQRRALGPRAVFVAEIAEYLPPV